MKLTYGIFLSIILATICWAIGSLYIYAIFKRYGTRIQNATSVEEAVIFRKRYLFWIKFEKVIFAILAFIGCFGICLILDTLGLLKNYFNEAYYRAPEFWIFWMVCELYYILLIHHNTKYSPITNAAVYTKKSKLPSEFILFLRGFGSDIYSEVYHQRRKNKDVFSENNFIKRLSLLYPCFAIGRPEELYAPSGSKRIYLDDKTWQEDVKEYMHKAKGIVILITDKPNCIWEVVQSKDLQEKTVYLVNNREKYKRVCESVPELYTETIPQDCKHFFLWYNNGRLQWKPFTNTGSSYWEIIKVLRGKCEGK